MPDVIDRPPASDADLYETDFYAWTQAQAEKLRARSANALDWENLAEEIEGVGKSQKHEIRDRLIVLLAHLLKWEFQPQKRCMSWQSSIGEQRTHISGILEDSPSLWRFPAEVLERSYSFGRRKASEEMGTQMADLPETCHYPIDDVLHYAFMPGVAWSPEDLIRD